MLKQGGVDSDAWAPSQWNSADHNCAVDGEWYSIWDRVFRNSSRRSLTSDE